MTKRKTVIYDDLYRRTGKRDLWTLIKELWIPQYRFIFIKRKCESTRNGGTLSRLAFLFWSAIYQHYKLKYHMDIPAKVVVGKGFRIGHIGGIVVNPNVVIGNNVDIYNGVLLGMNFRGHKKGCPMIKDNVFIGANSVVCGKITIGNDVLIAPNSYVDFDVPDHSVVLGNPAIIKPRNNATFQFVINQV